MKTSFTASVTTADRWACFGALCTEGATGRTAELLHACLVGWNVVEALIVSNVVSRTRTEEIGDDVHR